MSHSWSVEYSVSRERGMDVPVVNWRCPRCGSYRIGRFIVRDDGTPVSRTCGDEVASLVMES